jgi:hypothetical protein
VLKCVIMYCTVDKSHSSGASATQPRTMKDGKPPCKLFAAVFARRGSLSPPPHKKIQLGAVRTGAPVQTRKVDAVVSGLRESCCPLRLRFAINMGLVR